MALKVAALGLLRRSTKSIHPLSFAPALPEVWARTLVIVTQTLSKVALHVGGSEILVLTVPVAVPGLVELPPPPPPPHESKEPKNATPTMSIAKVVKLKNEFGVRLDNFNNSIIIVLCLENHASFILALFTT